MQQNQSEIMNNNQISPDKDKKPEKTKAEAVYIYILDLYIYFIHFIRKSHYKVIVIYQGNCY